MKRAVTIALSCTVAVLLPASVAVAGNGNGGKSLVSKACVAEKNGLKKELGNKAGKEAFRAIHGKQAMRNCKKGAAEEVEKAQVNASQECRAERDAIGTEAFAEKYGTNAPKGEKSKGAGKNAFGKCVSGKVSDEIDEDVEDTVNAAQTCRAARDADPEGFQETWGTNAPKGEKSKGAKRNAFGKCVSATAKQADEDDEVEDEGVPAPTG